MTHPLSAFLIREYGGNWTGRGLVLFLPGAQNVGEFTRCPSGSHGWQTSRSMES